MNVDLEGAARQIRSGSCHFRAFQPRSGLDVGRETDLRYKVSGSADMTDPSMVRALANPLKSMVRDSSATVVSAAMRIPFMRSSRIRRLPWRCRS